MKQGAQWHAMGRELLGRYPVYQNSLLDAGIYLKGLGCSWDPIEELSKGNDVTNVNDPQYSQTLCTVLQVALVDLLDTFGIRPSAVVGHSSGEIAAAYRFCVGALSRQAAWKVAYFRGLLAARLVKVSKTKGSMMAVGLPAVEANEYLKSVANELGESRLVVACVNSPKNVTVSGDVVHIQHLKASLDRAQVFARELKVTVAYHSFQMQEMAGEYLERIGNFGKPPALHFRDSQTMASSVTGSWISLDELSKPEYWVRNLVSPVLFSPALATVCSRVTSSAPSTSLKLDGSHNKHVAISDLVEVGPHSALQGPIKEILRSTNQDRAINYFSILIRNISAVHSTLDVVGCLYCRGYLLDLKRVNGEATWNGKRGRGRPRKCLVTLPEYPFNHSKSYWTESRLSKNFRFRSNVRHDLVGAQATDWNPSEAKWRNMIKAVDLPWVEDHKINGTLLYPATGMLVMAIEACKQLADPNRELTGFLFKHVSFHSALNILANSNGTEVNMYVRSRKDQDERDSGWYDFRLYTYSNDKNDWYENCNGSIQVVYNRAENEVDKGREEHEWIASRRSRYLDSVDACTKNTDVGALYSNLAQIGYGYGPTFRLMTKLNYNGRDTAVADIKVYRWSDHYEGNSPDQPHIIHPTTLDCILQSVLAVHTKGGTEKMATAVPTHVERLWIARKGLSHVDANLVRVYASGQRIGMRETENHITTFDETGTEILMDAERFKTTDVGSDVVRDDDHGKAVTSNLCHTIDWKPDLDLLSMQELQAFCNNALLDSLEPMSFFEEVDFLIIAYMRRTLKTLKDVNVDEWKPHAQMYFHWMKRRMEVLEQTELRSQSNEYKIRLEDEEHIDRMTKRVAASSKQGLFFTTVGMHHTKLITGEEDALSLLFNGDLVKDHYFEIEEISPAITRLRALIDAMVHKNSRAKFLEIGAGTGALTEQVMKTFLHHGAGEACSVPRYAQYDYTDLSAFFFGPAETKWGPNSRMRFKKLNIELDPETQGYDCGTYDGIFAAGVLHATPNLSETLKNCRKLLKPGGKLMLFEPTMAADGLRTNFCFGLLEGWWLSKESYRKRSPCLDEHKWDEVLKQNGFSGNDVVLHDYKSSRCREFSVLVTTAMDLKPTTVTPMDAKTEVVIIHGSDQDSIDLASSLKQRFQSSLRGNNRGLIRIRISSIQNAVDANFEGESLFIFLLEVGQPIWYRIGPELFESLKKIMVSNPTTKSLWVAAERAQDEETTSPAHYRLVDGLSRTLNLEAEGAALTCLTLQPLAQGKDGLILHDTQIHKIVQISERIIDSALSAEMVDTEYQERGGMLQVPRLIETTQLNEEVYRRALPHQVVQRKWSEPEGLPLRMIVGSPGLLNTMHFVEDKERSSPLAPEQVEIEVKSVGLNFRDVLIALGRIQYPTVGCECAGIVTRMGTGVPPNALKIGDRVATFPDDAYKSYIRIDWRVVAVVPDAIPLSVAAATPVNYATAWVAFQRLARVQQGETVLIHSAAGGTGQAAVQVAQFSGAEVLATVGTDSKKQFLIDTYGIAADHIFSSRDPTSFKRGVERITSGKGVDVIFNSLSGEGLVASWECIASYGRFIEIGKKDILARNSLPMWHFGRNVTFSALDLSTIPTERPRFGGKTLEEVFALMSQGKLKPAQPLHTYSVSELEKAFRSMQSGKMYGKTVINMGSDDVVEATLDTKPSFSFGHDGTYVIGGGLGGIGRGIARWLVERGARNLILLSRSGSQNPYAQKLVEDLTATGARVALPACDVCDIDALKAVMEACLKEGMPPVKGCIQASMVLRDAAFPSMTYEAWKAATGPKVQGTWNLHIVLPKNLDFFITLSSICGIVGSRGQANYAAGNTFQDALARYRASIGEHAAALDLGPLFTMGIMTEDKDLRKRWEHMVDQPVTEAELYALLDCYWNTSIDEGCALQRSVPLRCQVTVGLARWFSSTTRGVFEKPMCRNIAIGDNVAAGVRGANGKDGQQRVNFASVFANAASLDDAAEAVTRALARKLSSTLSLSLEEIDESTPMHNFGVDSLVAVELRNWFAKEVHADIAIFDILGGATAATIGTLAATKSKYHKSEWSQ
ncbi:MAG: hypothetical protein Q9227_005003 [Pyrenula ochraceoflavens]